MLDNKWRKCAEDVRRRNGVVSLQLDATKALALWLLSLPKGEMTIPLDIQRKTPDGEWVFTRENYRFSPSDDDVEAQYVRLMKHISFELARFPRVTRGYHRNPSTPLSYQQKEIANIELMTHAVIGELKRVCKTQADFMWFCERHSQVQKNVYDAVPVYYTDVVVVQEHRTKERAEMEAIQISALLEGLATLPKGLLVDGLDGREFAPDDVLVKDAARYYCNALLFYRITPRAFASSAELVDYVNTHIMPLGAFAQVA